MTAQDPPGSSSARDRRQVLVAALALGVAVLVPLALSALRPPPPPPPSSVGPSTSASSDGPGGAPARPRSTLHLAAGAAPGEARVTLDGADLGRVTRDPQDGGIRGEALLRLGAGASGLSTVHLEITRDPSVPVELADAIQRMLAVGGALDTRVVEPR